MKKMLRFTILGLGPLSVLIFCVSATASIAGATTVASETVSEPLSLLLVGVGLIGFSSFIRRKTIR